MAADPEDLIYLARCAQDDYRQALQKIEGLDVEIEGQILVNLARHFSLIDKQPET